MCVFGLFMAPDITAMGARLLALCRSGGQILVATWASGHMEPADSIFWEELGLLTPHTISPFRPWTRMTDANDVRRTLLGVGAASCEVVVTDDHAGIADPDDFWSIVRGSGYSAALRDLDESTRQELRHRIAERLRAKDTHAIALPAIFAVATAP